MKPARNLDPFEGELPMAVRDMNGDPMVWEDCYWRDLSHEEQDLWSALGWNEEVWDSQENVPATASQNWERLTASQQKAAAGLGFTQQIWDAFEDQ